MSATAVNASGQVAGVMQDEPWSQAARWTPESGRQTSGVTPDTWAYISVTGINASGTVVGTRDENDDYYDDVPFRWKADGQYQSLSIDGTHYNVANGINDAGQIAGTVSNEFAQGRAVVWNEDGSRTILNVPGSYQSAQGVAINNAGAVLVTTTQFNAYPGSSFLWRGQEDVRTIDSYATALNDSFKIGANRSNGSVFFMDADGNTVDIPFVNGDYGGQVVGITADGTVIGSSYGASSNTSFLWTKEDGTVDLNTLFDTESSGFTLSYVSAVSSTGYITGYGGFADGRYGHVVLQPNVNAVPEPATMAALGLGAVALIRRRRKA